MTSTPALEVDFRCPSCGALARVEPLPRWVAGKGGGKLVCTVGHESLPQTRRQLKRLEQQVERRGKAAESRERRIAQRYDVQADRR